MILKLDGTDADTSMDQYYTADLMMYDSDGNLMEVPLFQKNIKDVTILEFVSSVVDIAEMNSELEIGMSKGFQEELVAEIGEKYDELEVIEDGFIYKYDNFKVEVMHDGVTEIFSDITSIRNE